MDLGNYIGGDITAPASGRYLDNHEPATGEIWSRVPDSDGNDLQQAVDAATIAFPGWHLQSADQRSRSLLSLAQAIEDNAGELAQLESRDTGKPVALARSLDIPRAAANFRFFASAATQFHSEAHPVAGQSVNFTLRQAHGVVACISPWNLPLYLLSWKIAPALAAGNCVIAKPSELTPATAHRLAQLCQQVGLPAGVLNILHGSGPGIGASLVEHSSIKAVSFTGGTRTGAGIAARAAPRFKKLSLELGGKNPSIVFADADWQRMLDTTLRSAFANQGQICLCGSRILVQRSIYSRFREEFVARARAILPGDPAEQSTAHGALVSRSHMEKVLACIQRAREEGGTVLCGGERIILAGRCAGGWFVPPTVIDGLDAACHSNQEEIFGPVVTLMPFDTEEQALAMANATPYGLAASIWSQDIQRCMRLSEQIEAGMIWVNTWMLRDLRTPMGGTRQSGVGREGGMEAMRFFTEPKNVCIRYGDQP
jgi:aminomuconate-semialdehyde/2-hydroxymuconate-6-semialdehyde dehydrogenase